MKEDKHDDAPTFYVFGNPVTILAPPVRVSRSDRLEDCERLLATLSISDATRFRSFVKAEFGKRETQSGVYEVSAQHFVERLKTALDDGDLAECDFSLALHDWLFEKSETVFSRSFSRKKTTPRKGV